MKVYIDISNLMNVSFLTGIQRVVREVVTRLLKSDELEVVLLSSNAGKFYYNILDNEKFLEFYISGNGKKRQIVTKDILKLEDIEAGAVFFDIDSIWHTYLRRSSVYQELKKQGVRIATFVHDINPVMYPQYCHHNTTFFFMNYITAVLKHADIVLVSTKSTAKKIDMLTDRLELPRKKIFVTWLGATFSAKSNQRDAVQKEALAAAKSGRYILCVGTIEPRKNHKLLLDAYDKKLSDMGINLILAGKIGWNIKELKERIETHPKYKRGLYHLEGLNDASIDYLYKNAYAVAFPSFEEGFGLPVIEAMQRGCVTITSDIPVLREIGGEYCDYFDINSPDGLIALIEKYINEPEIYNAKKVKLKSYVPITWDQVSDKMENALLSLKNDKSFREPNVKQMVMLSAREEGLLETLPYIERFMDFIKEIVVCCPDRMAMSLKKNYKGRLKLTCLTDSEVLGDSKLPEDHGKRNFYLRCKAMQSDKLDDVFIMSDDDYRPLRRIDMDVYYQDGRYKGYYFYDLEHWTDNIVFNLTSFDKLQRHTKEFLKRNQYPCKHYAAHMPQIIDKRVFLEMLGRHPGIEEEGYCEWNTYFNYLMNYYPNGFEALPFRCICWPGTATSWRWEVDATDPIFENYYEDMYDEGKLFEGFSREITDNIEEENEQKISKYMELKQKLKNYQREFDIYSQMYICEHGERPQIGVTVGDKLESLNMPEFLLVPKRGVVRIKFEIKDLLPERDKRQELTIKSYYTDALGYIFFRRILSGIEITDCIWDFPINGFEREGNYNYTIELTCGDSTIKKTIPITVIDLDLVQV